MTNNPLIYHGEWWVPAVHDYDIKMTCFTPEGMMGQERKYKGTLTYHEQEGAKLELYHYPSSFFARHYSPNEVMWGKDANGNIFTLFNVAMKKEPIGDFTKIEFVVANILIGEHVISLNDTRFNICKIKFPYLRNWAFHDNIVQSNAGKSMSFKAPIYAEKLLETTNDEGACWRLWQGQTIERSVHDLTITQSTILEIEAIKELSLISYMRQIEEFTQFLSIALYGDQNPTEIKFTNRKTKRESILLFKKDASVNPELFSLIKFGLLKEKLPSMMNVWHENFEKIAPISSYLIDSLQKKNRFEVPDFLIIAQALDGYHKRFVNHKNQRVSLKEEVKDHQKKGRDKSTQYEKDINILISQFNDVNCIQKCHIDPQVLAQSRDKYSHLLTDEDKPLAVEGEDLYWLTEKCKILLTCCILNMLGLTNKEINLCCENSPISQIIDSFPPEWD